MTPSSLPACLLPQRRVSITFTWNPSLLDTSAILYVCAGHVCPIIQQKLWQFCSTTWVLGSWP
ncbi:hypothetical protein WG66_015779 [Moniliophthora roreri]|nr:hypothetical protein WG66_015779 [Moniliophthora roreri]